MQLDSFHGLIIHILLSFLEFKQPEHGFKSSKIFSMKSTVIKLNSRICCTGNETGCLNGGKLKNHLHKIMMPILVQQYRVSIKYLYDLSTVSPILTSIIISNKIWHDYYLWRLTVSEEYAITLCITLKSINKLHLTLCKVHYV